MGDAAEGADQIDLDRQLELLHRVGPRRLGFLVAADGLGGIGDAGAIDQHALLAVGRARPGERRRDLLVAGDVDLAEHAADFGRDLLAPLDVAIEHRDLGAAPRELARGRFAQPRSGAGNDRRNTLNVHSPALLLRHHLFIALCDENGRRPRQCDQRCRIATVADFGRGFMVNAAWIGDKPRYI